jgi:hypothetical protein
MSSALPWDPIALPASDYAVRRVEGSGAVPLNWGRDTEGRALFIVELEGDHTETYRRDVTVVHGIRTDLRSEKAGGQRLVLTLDRSIDQDLFHGLCLTLARSLATAPDSGVALAVALTHIRRWKAFLAGRSSRILSPEEVRGLVAELQYMRALYAGRLTQGAAVDAWCGVEKAHQDFMFGDTAVEVKSLAGRDRSTVRISSEDQLETVLDDLFLVVHRLSEADEGAAALSLNALVVAIEDELGDSDALESLSSKLAVFGYVPLPDYDAPRFLVRERRTYRVAADFPRLVRSALPGGIARLSYEIELEAMEPFRCGDDVVLEPGTGAP